MRFPFNHKGAVSLALMKGEIIIPIVGRHKGGRQIRELEEDIDGLCLV